MPKAKPIQDVSEHEHQANLIKWASLAVNTRPELEMLYAIPNGGLRNVVVAKKLKAEGVRAGIPDLALAAPAGQYNGLYIEMKSLTGKPTEHQKEWIAKLVKYGYKAVVCNGWVAGKEAIESYLDGNA